MGGSQALALQNGISAADGAGGHAQAVGQIALGRQFFAHGDLAIEDGLGQIFGDGLVLGLAAVAQAGGGNQLFKRHKASKRKQKCAMAPRVAARQAGRPAQKMPYSITLFDRIVGMQSYA
jgi:hypothetical protein